MAARSPAEGQPPAPLDAESGEGAAVEQVLRWHVVAAEGELDLASAAGLRDTLLTSINMGQHHVVLDLSAVTFVDSSGFAVLVGALKRLRALGGDLRLSGVDTIVQSALRVSGLAKIFGVYPDVPAATDRQSLEVMAGGSAPSLELAPDPRSPGLARDFVTRVLEDWGLGRLADTARLLTSELVTNAVLHAGTPLTLRVVRDGSHSMLRISVRDTSPARPRRKRYGELATTGRGLAMIDSSAQAFGVDALTDGKEVWVELPISPALGNSPNDGPLPEDDQ